MKKSEKEVDEKVKPLDKEEFKKTYNSIETINSPSLKEDVTFNAKGLNHIYYAGNRSERTSGDIAIRQHIFSKAVKLVKTSNIISGRHIVYRLNKNITYYEMIGLIENRRIKVVLRRMGEGKVHFWSIIPSWQYCSNGRLFNMSGKVLE